MTLSDILTAIATIATVVGTLYAALAYHRPKERRPVADPLAPSANIIPQQGSLLRRWPAIPFIAAIVAWTAVAFNFYDRHWLSVQDHTEVPIGTENARIDVRLWLPVWTDQKQLFVNAYFNNNGKNIAIGGDRKMATSNVLGTEIMDKDLVDAMFFVLHTKMRSSKSANTSEIAPGQDQYFTVPDRLPGMQFDDNDMVAVKNGAIHVYIFVLMRYSDNSVQAGKYIYRELCIYLAGRVVHNCESGHNRTFISD